MPRLKRIKQLPTKNRKLRLDPFQANYWDPRSLDYQICRGVALYLCNSHGQGLFSGKVLNLEKAADHKVHIRLRHVLHYVLWPDLRFGAPRVVNETSRITKPSRSSRRR